MRCRLPQSALRQRCVRPSHCHCCWTLAHSNVLAASCGSMSPVPGTHWQFACLATDPVCFASTGFSPGLLNFQGPSFSAGLGGLPGVSRGTISNSTAAACRLHCWLHCRLHVACSDVCDASAAVSWHDLWHHTNFSSTALTMHAKNFTCATRVTHIL
jgi:hypothetical protein